MPYADAKGVKLYWESTGKGDAIVFVHEFAGDHRSWEPQVRYFGRRYRCITFNARGYTPSEVPTDPKAYIWQNFCDDIAHVMRAAGEKKAHIVGLSMGGYAALHFALRHPRLARSIVAAGAGSGSEPAGRAAFRRDVAIGSGKFLKEGMAKAGSAYAGGATRQAFKRKDPRGWQEFHDQLGAHSSLGSSLTFKTYQRDRPSLRDFEPQFAKCKLPTLLILGDEDEPCLDTNLRLKRIMPAAGLVVVPRTGHTVNLEEPDAFNAALDRFFADVEHDAWPARAIATGPVSAVLAPGMAAPRRATPGARPKPRAKRKPATRR